MNSAKKIMKNQGIKSEKRTVRAESNILQKNKVLLIIGLLIMAALVGAVCYINLRPRAILKVEAKEANGSTTTHTIYYKEAMYDIYNTEMQDKKRNDLVKRSRYYQRCSITAWRSSISSFTAPPSGRRRMWTAKEITVLPLPRRSL